MQAYGAHFVQKIRHKHLLAQNYFSHIPGMAEEIKAKVDKLPLPRPKEREIIVTMSWGHSQEPHNTATLTSEEGRGEVDTVQN